MTTVLEHRGDATAVSYPDPGRNYWAWFATSTPLTLILLDHPGRSWAGRRATARRSPSAATVRTGWRPGTHPPRAPVGQAHGANAFCVSEEGIVLISSDGEHWGWPGGRPEGNESWEQTLRREVLEKTCSNVIAARLLGFDRSTCLKGYEEGLVLVRSI
jgi:hypothetical protein